MAGWAALVWALLALFLVAGAEAATITSSGPLTSITISADLKCSVNHTGDVAGEFFNDTACGTFIRSGTADYGPAAMPYEDSGNPAYTPVSQSAVTGSGTSADPYTIVTVVDLGTSGLRLTETDSYVIGEESYTTDVALHNNGTASVDAIIYRAGDCYLQDSDAGFGSVDATTGAVACVNAVDDGNGGFVPGERIIQWFPLSAGSHYFEAGYAAVWAATVSGSAFPDTCTCATHLDNGAGLSWNVTVPAGATVTRSSLITFSPLGHQPLATTKTADSSSVAAGGADGYTITISNPNVTSVSLSSITDTLPAGFTYTAGSTTGATTSNPSISGQNLTWSRSFSVPARPGTTPGTISLHFGVTASNTAGTYFNNAGGVASGYTVAPTGDTAPVTVTALAATLTVTKAGSGSGTVSSSPAGIDCGATCSAAFASGTSVTLTATAATGSTFAGWSGACSGTGSCVVTMDQARAVTATFTLQPPAVSCDLTLMPAGCWHFGEAPGSTTAIDSSPNHNDGTYLGGVTLGVPGVLAGNTAARFDGNDDYVRVPDSNSLDVGDSFSAEGWIKRSSVSKTHQLMNKGGNGLHLVVMAATSGNEVWLRKANVTTLARSTIGITADGRYHHVVATRNGPGSSRIYIDGVDRTLPVSSAQVVQNTAFPLIFSSGASTPVDYDEFALYDQVLTAGQVGARFALGAP